MREAASAKAKKIKIGMEKEEKSRAQLKEKKRIADEAAAEKKAKEEKENRVVSLRPVEAPVAKAAVTQDQKPTPPAQPTEQSVKEK